MLTRWINEVSDLKNKLSSLCAKLTPFPFLLACPLFVFCLAPVSFCCGGSRLVESSRFGVTLCRWCELFFFANCQPVFKHTAFRQPNVCTRSLNCFLPLVLPLSLGCVCVNELTIWVTDSAWEAPLSPGHRCALTQTP